MKKVVLLCMLALRFVASAQIPEDKSAIPFYLRDRGRGVATSMFGTYINKGEKIIYLFYEYYYDHNAEYKPSELGYLTEQDYRSRFKSHEGLIFLSYGITDRLAIEMEAAVISTATLYKSPQDNSTMPAKLSESGLGDVEGQLRWRWMNETNRRPELFSYFETVLPLQKDKKLIGTQDWEFTLGSGITKGFEWGTMTFRAAIEYNAGEKKFDPGEIALEYLKRVSKLFRFGLIVEGSQDEVSFITDMQFHLSPHVFIRLNSGFGITSKSPDFTPEIGVLFHF